MNIIGAFDRYNYGDLLFPIILERFLHEKFGNNTKINVYGLIDSNLSNIGALETKSYDKMPKSGIFIIGGGDVIGSNILDLYIHLQKNTTYALIFKILKKIIPKKHLYKKVMKKLNVYNKYPWVLNNEKNRTIIYNSVGSGPLAKLNNYDKNEIKKLLNTSDYISVRDDFSKKNLELEKVKTYPDSAILMSKYFSTEELIKKSSEEINSFINKNKKYICFQVNKEFLKMNSLEEVTKQLSYIISRGYKIVLLPIGFAAGHEDCISLNKIYKKMNSKDVVYFSNINIFEIMHLISKSYCFIGTSLHGNLTAMSFAVRHIGLRRKYSKLDNNLDTWEKNEIERCCNIEELGTRFDMLENITKTSIKNNSNKLINLAEDNFKNIYDIIKNNNK